MKKTISKTTADLGLLSVTLFWGTTFILSKQVLEVVPLPSFLAVRLFLAAIFMVLIALPRRSNFTIKTLKHGVLLGSLLFFSYVTQMSGLKYTTASNAGFITGLSVVFVPIFSILFFKAHPKKNALIGVAIATAGLLLLSGGNPLEWNKGDYLVLICAFLVTFHIILTGKFSRENDIYLLTAVQLSVTGLLSITALPFSNTPLYIPSSNHIMLLVYLALFGTVYTFLMQTAMQQYTTNTRTALVFTMEPVFATFFAYIFAGEILSSIAWVGGILILLGMLSAEIDWIKK